MLADAGLPGLLVTTPVVTPSMVARLALAAEKADGFTVLVDSLAGVEAFATQPAPTGRSES